MARVAKASILTRQPTGWLSLDVRAVSKGLDNAQDLSFRCQNFMMAPDFLNLIRTVELNNECGLAAFMSFLLALRVPSETLTMRSASDTDMQSQITPKEHMVLAGIRMF